ncbi:MAG: hypothetical protein R2697_06955 [Ilumatobacteraceae bacterium]
MMDLNRIPRPTTRLGLQIPNFTYDGAPPERLFAAVADQAVTAEQNGFDSIFVMDHFFQLLMLGPTDAEMFEAYTLLGAPFRRPHRHRPSRHAGDGDGRRPAVLAKILSTLDVIQAAGRCSASAPPGSTSSTTRPKCAVPARVRAGCPSTCATHSRSRPACSRSRRVRTRAPTTRSPTPTTPPPPSTVASRDDRWRR